MATSSIPTLKANLLSALQARPNLSNIQVTYGPPLPNPAREFVWLADVAATQAVATMGMGANGLRAENYELEVIVSVTQEGTDANRQQAATERAFALLAEVETQAKTDPTIGGAVSYAEVGTNIDLNEPTADNQRTANVIAHLKVQNWI